MSLNSQVADWLDEHVDSHGIYAVSILDSLPAGITYDAEKSLLSDSRSTRRVRLTTMSAKVMEREEGAVRTGNPKGAYLDPGIDPSTILTAGYWLSSALDKLLTGEDAGSRFFGRGSAHRASVAHIRSA